MDSNTDTDQYRYNTEGYRLINFLNFIWNSRFDRWIDCIHDSKIQMDTDTDGHRHRWIKIEIQMQIQMDMNTVQMDTDRYIV